MSLAASVLARTTAISDASAAQDVQACTHWNKLKFPRRILFLDFSFRCTVSILGKTISNLRQVFRSLIGISSTLRNYQSFTKEYTLQDDVHHWGQLKPQRILGEVSLGEPIMGSYTRHSVWKRCTQSRLRCLHSRDMSGRSYEVPWRKTMWMIQTTLHW